MAGILSVGDKKVKEVSIGNNSLRHINIGTANVYTKKPPVYYNTLEPFDYIKDVTYSNIYINYYDAVFDINEDVIIPFYFSDYFLREYRYNDHSLNFKLTYMLDGNKTVLENQKAGDNTLNFGKLSKGYHRYSIQVEDPFGNPSRSMFYDFLVKDKAADLQNIEAHTYTMVEDDLTKYNIKNNDSVVTGDPKKSKDGLNLFFKDLAALGYRKCIMLKGTYRLEIYEADIDKSVPVNIPSNFTLDMNGATFKLNPYHVGLCCMIEFKGCINGHITNGTLEGGLLYRNENNWYHFPSGEGAAGETEFALSFNGARFCSCDKVTFTLWTGYILVSGGTDTPWITKCNEWFYDTRVVNGIEKHEYNWMSTRMCDVRPELKETHYLVGSRWLGYGGCVGDTLYITFNFYDVNELFISSAMVYQYTPCEIPENAEKFRVTIKGTVSDASGLCYHHMLVSKDCKTTNCMFIDNNTCTAIGQSRIFLMKDNTFIRCGQRITPCEIDLEDGWELMQDVFIIHNTGAGVIDNSGYNHQFINNINSSFNLRGGTNGIVIKDNIQEVDGMSKIRFTLGYKNNNNIRCFNNENFVLSGKNPYNYIYSRLHTVYLKNNKNVKSSFGGTSPYAFVVSNCDVLEKANEESFYKDCTIRRLGKSIEGYLNNSLYYTDCTFKSDIPGQTMYFRYNLAEATRIYTRCIFTDACEMLSNNCFNSGIWDTCTFNNTVFLDMRWSIPLSKKGDLRYDNCIFNKPITILNNNKDLWVLFNNCEFKEGIVLKNENTKLYTEFNNCKGIK